MITLGAPAKVNLTLEVLGKRSDGYHEVRTLMQAIDLCDLLTFEPADGITLKCAEPELSSPDNLVMRAARLLAERSGRCAGASITLEKHIPVAAGLGGGSSDAAATLMGLNLLWSLAFSKRDLFALAGQLGSDVPFFLYQGTALAEGRGERTTPLPDLSDYWLVIAVPPIIDTDRKTARLYHSLLAEWFTDGRRTAQATQCIKDGLRLEPQDLFNVFEKAAPSVFRGLEEYWRQVEELSRCKFHLAGSGPALFAWFTEEATATEAHIRLRPEGLTTYLTRTVPACRTRPGSWPQTGSTRT